MLAAIARKAGETEIALSVVTLIELAHGVARADTGQRKQRPSPLPDTTPDADFCSVVRSPYGHLSRQSDTEQISWGKFSHFPCTIAESTFRPLMDMDFAVSRPLVRH